MRKARVEEPSKSISTRGRSQTGGIISQVATKGEILDKKKRTLDHNKAVSEGKSKTLIKTSSTLPKQTGSGEPDRQSSSLNAKLQSSNVASTRGTLKTTSRTILKNPTDGSKARSEKKSSSEKRGVSTIYMPKTASSKSFKSLGPTEVSKAQVTNSITRSKDASRVKNPTEKIKEASSKSKNQYPTSQRLPSRERRRSRTLSPSEVKVLRSGPQNGASSSKKALPLEARTSRDRGSNKVENIAVKNDTDEEYVYEDDFEDYESDFEECTDSEVSEVSESSNKSDELESREPIELRTEKQKTTINSVEGRKSDEDRMLDSGHYELAEARRRAARVETMSVARDSKSPTTTEIIVQPSISPYREEKSNENKSLPSSMDEGFEDSRSGDFAKSPTLSRIAFIDFRKIPKENPILKPTIPKILSRGEKLLEMIKLDTVEWSIHESQPVAYEEFIRTHGKLNTRQICIQTNEDNLDVETQTDGIECMSKWTQFPARCRNILKTDNDIKLFNMERLGVGSEDNFDTINTKSRPIYDVLQLNEFLNQAGKVMLSLLEEKTSSNNTITDNVHELPFSESIVKLSIDNVTFLAGRPVTMIHYSNISNRILMTIHAPAEEEIETSRDEDFVTDCSIGCVWNILQPSRPIKMFYSSSKITACCFHSTSYNVVLAGLEDGSISLWDLAENETWHRKIVDDNNRMEWVVRSPTFSSIGNFEANCHDSEIVALRVLSKIEGEYTDVGRNKFMPIQISSLDANGKLIVWSVLRNMNRANVDDLGLSWWGDLRLVKSQEISLYSKKTSERNNHLKGFSDMHVDRLDTNALYIATNTTNILHATRIGKHANPPAYKSNEMDWCGETKCIENCPFDQPFFLVGCGDGTVRLHSTTAEKPLLQLKHEECNASIKALQWSKSKPLTIYVLDVDSKIHVWDLGSSDMFPIYSISTKNWAHIDSIELSPCRTSHEMTNQYMALASDNGCVEVHKLKNDFYYSHKDFVKREMNTFLRYVEIL